MRRRFHWSRLRLTYRERDASPRRSGKRLLGFSTRRVPRDDGRSRRARSRLARRHRIMSVCAGDTYDESRATLQRTGCLYHVQVRQLANVVLRQVLTGFRRLAVLGVQPDHLI